jgi:hypothetical protein
MPKRPRSKRKNKAVMITGLTGSGKSRMGETLADPWPRVVYIDPTDSFVEEDELSETVVKVRTHNEFVVEWTRLFNEPEWRVDCVFPNEDDYALVFEDIWKVITNEEFPDERGFLLVIDEADMFSDPQWIDENLRHLAKRGRHFGISYIVICQFETDTNKTFRGNASEVLIFKQGMLSPDMLRRLKGTAKIRERPIPEVSGLKEHDIAGPAVEDVHFIACPDDFDTFMVQWEELATQATE